MRTRLAAIRRFPDPPGIGTAQKQRNKCRKTGRSEEQSDVVIYSVTFIEHLDKRKSFDCHGGLRAPRNDQEIRLSKHPFFVFTFSDRASSPLSCPADNPR